MLACDELKMFILECLHTRLAETGMKADELVPSFNLISSGLLDSLGFLQLVAEVEARFQVDIDFSDHDPQVFTSLEGLIRCVLTCSSE